MASLDMTWPVVASDAVAWISADQMREMDRVAIDLGLSLPQMMENAGIHLSEVAGVPRTGAESSGGDTYRGAATTGAGLS